MKHGSGNGERYEHQQEQRKGVIVVDNRRGFCRG
jgi:hypothetical protein